MAGIFEWFENLKGEVHEKSRNPFFPTFIAVWAIRHWEAVYSFFFFDESFKLDQRIERFKCYFEDYTYWTLLGTIGVTFGVILSGYILGNLTRLLSNFFEYYITPNIYKLTASGKTRMKSELDELQSKYDNLEVRFDAIRIEKIRLTQENEELLSKISNSNESKTVDDDQDTAILEKYGILREDTGLSFLEIASQISASKKINRNSKDVIRFSSLGLIKPVTIGGSSNEIHYQLSSEGREVFRILSKDR